MNTKLHETEEPFVRLAKLAGLTMEYNVIKFIVAIVDPDVVLHCMKQSGFQCITNEEGCMIDFASMEMNDDNRWLKHKVKALFNYWAELTFDTDQAKRERNEILQLSPSLMAQVHYHTLVGYKNAKPWSELPLSYRHDLVDKIKQAFDAVAEEKS